MSLDDAARDIHLRADQLGALEEEVFEALAGEVYARATLRTYAAYLGLNADKVVEAYARHTQEPTPPLPPDKLGRVERTIAATRIRDNQRLLLVVAVALVVVLLVFGLLSRDHAAPQPAAIPTVTPAPISAEQTVDAVLVAQRDARATVTVDGDRRVYAMSEGEELSFRANEELTIEIVQGGTVQVQVAGIDYGSPGEPGVPWRQSFTSGLGEGAPSSPGP